MTNEEAINVLKTDSCYECTWGCTSAAECANSECSLKEAVNMAIEALEKQIPKKPSVNNHGVSRCSVCGMLLHQNRNEGNYCHFCGQKVADWSDSND